MGNNKVNTAGDGNLDSCSVPGCPDHGIGNGMGIVRFRTCRKEREVLLLSYR